MQTLIHKKPIFYFLPSNFASSSIDKNQNFLKFHLGKCRYTSKTLTLCTSASSDSLSYGGWDDLQRSSNSVQPGESAQLLNLLGIGDKKYVFVYLFGFVCALAVSRVKVSSIVVFPACAVLFAVGFSVGFVKGGHLNGLGSNESKSLKHVDEKGLRSFIEKMRNLGDNLSGYNSEVLNLRNDIRRGVEANRVTVSDLEGYVDVIDSADMSFRNAMDVLESCVKGVLSLNEEKEVGLDQEVSRRKKRSGEMGLNFSRYFNGLFGGMFDGLKPSKVKNSGLRDLVDVDVDSRKKANILASSSERRNLNFGRSGNLENKNADLLDDSFDRTDRSPKKGSNVADVFGNNKNSVAEKNVRFDDMVYSYQNNTSRFVNSEEAYVKDYQDEIETADYQNGTFDSMNFSISMEHTKTAASFSRHQKSETLGRNYTHYESTEEDSAESQRYTFRKGMYSRNESMEEDRAESQRYSFKREMFKDSPDENVLGSSQSLVIGDDLDFSKYLTEADDLLKEAKRSLKLKVIDHNAEHALHKSAELLSKAIEMRPMSLLAVGQLGNTYLLHGELKLRISRDLRSILGRTDSFSVEERRNILNRFEDRLANKDDIISALIGVCEECEDLLIRAGRKFKLALSIDGNDIRALHNWGLALSFRAQLIADTGPAAARDADKVFLAAIDKFDAMMSRGNAYAPDALFRWGTILQQRSRLRPKTGREKVKLLQQARRLYEDALDMDSGNPQVQKALSSCVSELESWYR